MFFLSDGRRGGVGGGYCSGCVLCELVADFWRFLPLFWCICCATLTIDRYIIKNFVNNYFCVYAHALTTATAWSSTHGHTKMHESAESVNITTKQKRWKSYRVS